MPLREPFLRGKSWYYELDRRRISLKTQNEAEARAIFKEIKKQYLAGKLSEISNECRVTIKAFADEWEEWAEGTQGQSTFRANRLALRKIQTIAGDNCRLDRLTLRHVDMLVKECRGKGLSTASINNYIRHARSVLNKAVEWGHVRANPLARAKELPREKKPPQYLQGVEVSKFLSSIDDIDARRMVAAYLATGRRRTELIRLEKRDLDLEGGRYLVRKSKTHLSRWYPISDAFRAILASMEPLPDGYLFARWTHPDSVSKVVKRALRRFGHPEMRLHDLRHTFAVAFMESGGDLRTLQDLLGHSEYRTTEIYAHVSDDHLAREVQRVKLGPVDLFADNLRTGKGGSKE